MGYPTAASMIEFVNSIPKDTNAFLATSELLQSLAKAPAAPIWQRVSTRLCLAGYVIMLLQSGLLLAQRIKLGSFKTVHFNKLGLLVIKVSDPASICVLSYSSLTIHFMTSQLAEENGPVQPWAEMVLHQLKPLISLANAWAFLWASSCQCAVILWETDSVRNLSMKKRGVLQAAMKWGMNTFFLFVNIAPVPLISYKSWIAYSCYAKILSVVHEISASLIAASDTFNPQTYNKLVLLKLLTPAQGISAPYNKMEASIRFITKFWMFLIGALSFICIPVLFLVLNRLYKQTASQISRKSRMHMKIIKTRKQFVLHALAVYLSVAIYFPVLAWLDFHSSTGFGLDSRWRAVGFVGTTAPFCITGNIMVLILNLNSRDTLRDMKGGPRVNASDDSVEEIEKSHTSSGTGTLVITAGTDKGKPDVTKPSECIQNSSKEKDLSAHQLDQSMQISTQ